MAVKVSIQDITKSFGGWDVFSHFSLEIDTGVRLCICGPNGTGKSTLLRMVSGKEECDGGRIILPKNCRLGYVEQELTAKDQETELLTYVLDVLHDWSDFWKEWEEAEKAQNAEQLEALMRKQNELEHLYGYNPEQRAKKVLSGLSFPESRWHKKLGELSGGWQERAKLARVLTAGADILLLDEPTNHLDIDAIEWLESFLLSFEGVLLFVAHDRTFMDTIATHVLYLGLSKPVFRKTNYSQFLVLQEEYAVQRERERQALQDELARKKEFVDRFRAKATKARQAASHQKMAKKLEKELEEYRPEPKRKELKFQWPEAPHIEKVVLAVSELEYRFEDGKILWPKLTFTLYRGSRIALVGHNGCGKSTLLKLLSGTLQKSGGNIASAQQLRLGYYTQHQMETLRPDTTVLGEIRRLSDPHTTEEELMSVLGLFLLGESYFDRMITDLSGGEKCRLVLASLFLRRCNVLLLDEPTNHLDLESREALCNALRNYSGTLMMVAHDRWLLSELNVETWQLTDKGLTVYENYPAYEAAHLQELQNRTEKKAEKSDTTKPLLALSREEMKRQKREEAEKRNALYRKLKPLQKKYEDTEQELNSVLERQASIEQELADAGVYADKKRASDLLRTFEECRQQSETLFMELSDLEARIEEAKAAENS